MFNLVNKVESSATLRECGVERRGERPARNERREDERDGRNRRDERI